MYFPYLMRKQLQPHLKPVLLLLLAAVLCSCGSKALAQGGPRLFQVIHLPRKAGYSKEKLNNELAPLKDKEAVKKLLRFKNFPSQTTLVLQVNRPGGLSTYWTINTSAPSDKEDSRIILQSRDNSSTRFYKLSEFGPFFKDTVAVIDTLAIEIFIRDDRYPDDGYLLSVQCGKSLRTRPLPLHDGRLLFTKALTDSCGTQPSSFTLYNNRNTGRTLASGKIFF